MMTTMTAIIIRKAMTVTMTVTITSATTISEKHTYQ